MGEVRYSSLTRTFPDNAEDLFKRAEEDMKERYETYKQMAASKEE
jgi:pyruvate-ferredoxin/flavodoxin oxidoreductase